MNKKQLLKMPRLKATSKMFQLAKEDKPVIKRYGRYETRFYQRWLYLRCCTKNDILKLSCFLAGPLREKESLPKYEIYFSKSERTYLTYDVENSKWLTGSFERLEWPSYRYHRSYFWCDRETRKRICQYFNNGDTDVLKIIKGFQSEVMEERLKRRHKKETDPWDEDLKQTPELPKDWVKWVDKVGIPEQFIFYHYTKTKLQRGYCTFCEQEVLVNARHNKEGICPHCHRKVTFKALGKFKWHSTERYPAYLLQKCRDGFMIREFEIHRDYTSAQYKTPSVRYFEYRRVIGDQQGILQRAYWYGLYKQIEHRWMRGGLCNANYISRETGKIYGKTLSSLFKKELKTTGLQEIYRQKGILDPESYLVKYKQYPYLEKILKVGLFQLADELMNNRVSYNFTQDFVVHQTESSLIKLLCLKPSAFRRLCSCNGGMELLVWLQYETATGKVIPDDTINWIIGHGFAPRQFQFIRDKMSIVQIENYIKRQMAANGMNAGTVVNTWADYLSMAERLGYDTDDEIIYRVRKLKQRHDELVELCKAKADTIRAGEILKEYPSVEQNLAEIKSTYEYADDAYAIIVPKKIEEILSEGRRLHHCVADSERYWDRIERKESYVFFLRKSKSPHRSYYTLEVEPGGTIRQKRTMYDRQTKDIERATNFLRKWQTVIQSRLSEADRKLATQSRVLRLENFKQLRKDNVISHTGNLQGQKLVDVLMADLMEAA